MSTQPKQSKQYYCPKCDHIAVSAKTLQTHLDQAHPGWQLDAIKRLGLHRVK